MSDGDEFLRRWSRRKAAASSGQPAAAPDEARPAAGPAADAVSSAAPAGDSANDRPAQPTEAPKPFDLSSLPSLGSIAADTDIRGFFTPGVPAELTRAALRRAWAADPKIRDFVGLEDYAWDFNAPGSIPGFGPLTMTDELRREVARMIGAIGPEPEPEAADAGNAHETGTERADEPELPAPPTALLPEQARMVTPPFSSPQTAAIGGIPAPEAADEPLLDVAQVRRGHGGALPR